MDSCGTVTIEKLGIEIEWKVAGLFSKIKFRFLGCIVFKQEIFETEKLIEKEIFPILKFL